MASTYTNGLGIELIGAGDKAGSWGDVTNNNLRSLEEGISRYVEIGAAGSNTSTLNIPDGQTAYTDDSKGRSAVIKWTGAIASGDSHTVTLQVGSAESTQARFIAINGLSSSKDLIIDTASGTSLTIPNGYSASIHLDSSKNVVNSFTGLSVEKIALKNNEIISNETNDEIIVAADTVKVGDDGAATLSSNGDQDLILKTGNSTTGSITITDGSNGNIDLTPNGTGEVNISKVDIAGGEVDGTVIGGNSAAAGTFTTLAGTTSVTTPSVTNAAALGVTTTASDASISITPHGTGKVVMDKVDIGGGAIDATPIGAASANTGKFTAVESTGTTSALHLSAADSYASFGSTAGSGGHGVRDSSGVLQVRNTNSDAWGQPYHTGMVSGQGSYFEQASISIASGDHGPYTHGFSSIPSFMQFYLVCGTAEHSYSAGDYLPISPVSQSISGTGQYGFSVQTTTTTIKVFVAGGGMSWITQASSGLNLIQQPSSSNWTMTIKCWK